MADQILVETFEIEQAEWPGDDAPKEEYEALIEELNLTGQKQLLESDGFIPFQKMDEAMKNIWGIFCPAKCALKEYRQGIIPVRLLNVVKECDRHKYFTRYEVWSESHEKDPILIGNTGDHDWSTGAGKYLIGRWGLALLPWSEIIEIARKRWVAKCMANATLQIASIEAKSFYFISGKSAYMHITPDASL